MNTPQQNNSGFSKLDDDILSIIFTMIFVSSDFRKCHKIISEINKQFYRIVLNIIPILPQINFYNINFIKNNKTKKLTKILKKTKNITTLELKGININSNSFFRLLFLENYTKLTTFCFKNSFVYFDTELTKEWYPMYHNFLTFLRTTPLVELNVSHIEIGNTQNEIDIIGGILLAITDALKEIEFITLTTLILGNNNIGYNGAIAISEAVKINKTLTLLDLRCCNIGYDGAIAIAEAVKKNKTLTLLDLRDCNIGYRGAKAIAEALKTNTRIQIITT